MDERQMRACALNEAVKYAASPNTRSTTEAVVNTAEQFYTFLSGGPKSEEKK